jgi:hypothetical protein
MSILDTINEYSNLILVAITIVYAWLTYQTVGIMRRQVTANIRISKVYLRTSTAVKRENFKISSFKDLAKRPYASLKDMTFVFRLFVDFVNVSYGAGAIDQPKLKIKFAKEKYELSIRPTSERIGSGRRTLVVPGGGFVKIDLDYFVAFDEKFIEKLKKMNDDIEYYVVYRDNSGKCHQVKIVEIDGLK